MHLQESGEMYLETIYVLSKEHPHVRSIDISEHMNYSKPSVSRAISVLKKADYVLVDDNGFLTLTPSGLEIAEKIYERHLLLTRFLKKIGLDDETATTDACKMEHSISDKTFLAIKKHIEDTN